MALCAALSVYIIDPKESMAKESSVMPIELFTRSLTNYYTALKQCSDIEWKNNRIDTEITTIVTYVKKLYPAGIPYWVLPNVAQREDDPDICNYLLHKNALAYNQAVNEYVFAYPESQLPPAPSLYFGGKKTSNEELLFGDEIKSRQLQLQW